MKASIVYREIQKSEEEAVCRLVMDCFDRFVAPGYSQEGIAEFSQYVTPSFMAARLADNHFIILALDGQVLAGMIEVRNFDHVSLFFVKEAYQGRGIGKKLNALAVEKCRLSKPGLTSIDVHSSPFAVPVYEKLGFVPTNSEQLQNGIRYTPMTYNLSKP